MKTRLILITILFGVALTLQVQAGILSRIIPDVFGRTLGPEPAMQIQRKPQPNEQKTERPAPSPAARPIASPAAQPVK